MPHVPWQAGDDITCKRGHDLREVGFYLATTGRWRWCAECQRIRSETTTAMRNIDRPRSKPAATVRPARSSEGKEQLNVLGWGLFGKDYEIVTAEEPVTPTQPQAPEEPDAAPFGLSPEVWEVYRADRKHDKFSARARSFDQGLIEGLHELKSSREGDDD